MNRVRRLICGTLSILVLLVTLWLLPTHAETTDIRWSVYGNGVNDHSELGKGFEFRTRLESESGDLFRDTERVKRLLSGICTTLAPKLLPNLREVSGLADPKFITVRLVTGKHFGRMAQQFFAVSGDDCGAPL